MPGRIVYSLCILHHSVLDAPNASQNETLPGIEQHRSQPYKASTDHCIVPHVRGLEITLLDRLNRKHALSYLQNHFASRDPSPLESDSMPSVLGQAHSLTTELISTTPFAQSFCIGNCVRLTIASF
jgi:hypothetical protein